MNLFAHFFLVVCIDNTTGHRFSKFSINVLLILLQIMNNMSTFCELSDNFSNISGDFIFNVLGFRKKVIAKFPILVLHQNAGSDSDKSF